MLWKSWLDLGAILISHRIVLQVAQNYKMARDLHFLLPSPFSWHDESLCYSFDFSWIKGGDFLAKTIVLFILAKRHFVRGQNSKTKTLKLKLRPWNFSSAMSLQWRRIDCKCAYPLTERCLLCSKIFFITNLRNVARVFQNTRFNFPRINRYLKYSTLLLFSWLVN